MNHLNQLKTDKFSPICPIRINKFSSAKHEKEEEKGQNHDYSKIGILIQLGR